MDEISPTIYAHKMVTSSGGIPSCDAFMGVNGLPRRTLVIGVGGVTNGGKSTLCNTLTSHLTDHHAVPTYTLHMDDYFLHDDHPIHEHLAEYNGKVINWDRVEAVDFQRLVADVKELIDGTTGNSSVETGFRSEETEAFSGLLVGDHSLATNKKAVTKVLEGEVTSEGLLYGINKCDIVQENKNHVTAREANNHTLSVTCDFLKTSKDDVRCENFSRGNYRVLFIDGIMIYDHPGLQEFFSLRYFLHLSKTEAKQRRSGRNYPRGEPESYFEHYAWPRYCKSVEGLGLNKLINVHSILESDEMTTNRMLYKTRQTGMVGFSAEIDLNCNNVTNTDSSNASSNTTDSIAYRSSCADIVLLNGSDSIQSNCEKVLRDIALLNGRP